MFDKVWSVVQKQIVDANAAWDTAMQMQKQVTEAIITAEQKLESVLASLDEVVKQCTGKTGQFTPILDNDRITGIQVNFEQGGFTVSKILELDAPLDTQ